MKIIRVEELVNSGLPASAIDWAMTDIAAAVNSTVWPEGSDTFAIYPESGKLRGKGNGVVPIKRAFAKSLAHRPNWHLEVAVDFEASTTRVGNIDVVAENDFGKYCVEWETGNISSCHRSINKMCLGLLLEKIAFGCVVVPSRKMSAFLTDRISNFEELIPYLPFWRSFQVKRGYFCIVVVEHDVTSTSVPRIPKGTDGRALA